MLQLRHPPRQRIFAFLRHLSAPHQSSHGRHAEGTFESPTTPSGPSGALGHLAPTSIPTRIRGRFFSFHAVHAARWRAGGRISGQNVTFSSAGAIRPASGTGTLGRIVAFSRPACGARCGAGVGFGVSGRFALSGVAIGAGFTERWAFGASSAAACLASQGLGAPIWDPVTLAIFANAAQTGLHVLSPRRLKRAGKSFIFLLPARKDRSRNAGERTGQVVGKAVDADAFADETGHLGRQLVQPARPGNRRTRVAGLAGASWELCAVCLDCVIPPSQYGFSKHLFESALRAVLPWKNPVKGARTTKIVA